jgi:hypothetical protein
MSIANELSGDVASAILSTENHTPEQLNDLMETVLKVHIVLQHLDHRSFAAASTAHEEVSRNRLRKPKSLTTN